MSSAFSGRSYEATCTLSYTDLSGIVSANSLEGLLSTVLEEESLALPEEANISIEADLPSQSIDVTAHGDTFEDASAVAVDLVERSVNSVREILVTQGESFLELASSEDTYGGVSESITVESSVSPSDRLAALQSVLFRASVPQEAESGSIVSVSLKYAAVGLVGGLFCVVLALSLVDAVRRPLKYDGDIKAVTDLPILANATERDFCKRLLANCRFANGDELESVCIVPVAGLVDDQVVTKMEDNPYAIKILPVESIAESVDGAQRAHCADATVVLVELWKENEGELARTLAELKLARANVVGVAVVS